MMIAFDYLSSPIVLKDDKVNVLCIENKPLFRNVIKAFVTSNLEESNIVLSKDFTPIDFKKNAVFIYDYFNLDFPSAFIKKTYDDIAMFCNTELQEDANRFRACYEMLFDRIVKEYDFDFEYNEDYALQMFFKACDLRPSIHADSLVDNLLQFVLMINKYSNINCFVFANLHLYFSENELKEFYSDLFYNHIFAFVIENESSFERQNSENVIIIDTDLCEIVD